MMKKIPTIEAEGLTAEVEEKNSQLKVSLQGEIDMEDPEKILDPFFSDIHELARGEKKGVTIDLEGLKFMNSSGIKSIIRWISLVNNGEDPYEITFLCNPNLTWQKTSLKVIQMIASDIVRLEDKEQ